MPTSRFALLAATLAALSLPAHAAPLADGEIVRPEGARHFVLAMPQAAAERKRPLVIVLHGHGGSGAAVLGKSAFNSAMQEWGAIAEREQLLVIAPDGAKGSDDKRGWNDCRADASTNPKTDDVGFIGALIDKAVADYGADPARVFVIGTSNGGGMVYRLASEMAPRLAGVAAVAALWPAHSLCAPPRQPVPVLVVHGTDDGIVPYAGGEVGGMLLRGRGSAIGVEETVAIWRKVAGLDGEPARSTFAHRDESGRTSAQKFVWGADARGVQVEFIKVERGGHTEPSVRYRMKWMFSLLLGKQNADFEVAEEAWGFFRDKRVGAAERGREALR